MTASRTRILLTDDHPLFREGLRSLLRGERDFEIVAEESDGAGALASAERLRPDVAVMDISLQGLDGPQGLNGIEATRKLIGVSPLTRVVVLSMHADANTVSRAFTAGARAYVLKGGDFRTLCQAIRAVVRGELYVSPELSGRGPGHSVSDESPLSDREREVLALIADGNTSKEIAAQLGLRVKTVENHRANIKAKLGILTTAGLVRYVLSGRPSSSS